MEALRSVLTEYCETHPPLEFEHSEVEWGRAEEILEVLASAKIRASSAVSTRCIQIYVPES